MFQILKSFALLGGEWVIVVMLLLSLWAMAVAWNRFFYFKERGGKARELDAQLPALLVAGKADAARELCRKTPCPESSVLEAGLAQIEKGVEAAEQAMESRRLGERLDMEKHLLVLGTLGNNIPFVGLFGTVLGIIKAFNDLALSGTSGPTVVMRGVAEALVSTALGLLIAIPIVAVFNHFQDKVRRTLLNADRLSRLFLSNARKSSSRPPTADR
jgi:biopolymer transport protein ExbB